MLDIKIKSLFHDLLGGFFGVNYRVNHKFSYLLQ